VFVEEQGVARELELDGLDPEAVQIVALDGDEIVATCRLRFAGEVCNLERMAVEAGSRGSGVGAELLNSAEDEARRRGATEMQLKAQLQARAFYERGGYAATSEEVVLDAGIEHVQMRMDLG
jgi:predicted GNAT family N-acyltransferase